MTQSNGQMDVPICNTYCQYLESSQRHAGADCHATRMTGRKTSNATHAALLKRLHPCASTSRVASTNPTMVTSTIGLLFRKYLYCPFISASCPKLSWFYLDVERGVTRSTGSVFYFGMYFSQTGGLLPLPYHHRVRNQWPPSANRETYPVAACERVAGSRSFRKLCE